MSTSVENKSRTLQDLGVRQPCEIIANFCYAPSPRTLLFEIVRHTGQFELDIGTY